MALVESEDTMQACSLMGMCMGSLTSMIKPVPLPVPLLRAVHAVRPALEKLMALAPARHRLGMGCGKSSKKESAVESSKAEGKATYAHGSLLSGVVSPLLMQQQANQHAASLKQDGCDTCKVGCSSCRCQHVTHGSARRIALVCKDAAMVQPCAPGLVTLTLFDGP